MLARSMPRQCPQLTSSRSACLQPPPAPPAAAVEVRATAYNACMDVLDSDHKPVWASLAVSLPVIKHAEQRRLVSHLFKAATEGQPQASLSLSASKLSLSQVGFGVCLCSTSGLACWPLRPGGPPMRGALRGGSPGLPQLQALPGAGAHPA